MPVAFEIFLLAFVMPSARFIKSFFILDSLLEEVKPDDL
jgi:hypothetical protein